MLDWGLLSLFVAKIVSLLQDSPPPPPPPPPWTYLLIHCFLSYYMPFCPFSCFSFYSFFILFLFATHVQDLITCEIYSEVWYGLHSRERAVKPERFNLNISKRVLSSMTESTVDIWTVIPSISMQTWRIWGTTPWTVVATFTLLYLWGV